MQLGINRFRYLRADAKKYITRAKLVLQTDPNNIALVKEMDFDIVKMLGRVEERTKDLVGNSKVLPQYQEIYDELLDIHKRLGHDKVNKQKIQIINRSKKRKSEAILICPLELEVKYR